MASSNRTPRFGVTRRWSPRFVPISPFSSDLFRFASPVFGICYNSGESQMGGVPRRGGFAIVYCMRFFARKSAIAREFLLELEASLAIATAV